MRKWREVMGLNSDLDKMDGSTVYKIIKKFNGEVRKNHEINIGDDYWYLDQKMISIYVDK